MPNTISTLTITEGTSRAADTYGYTLITLTDSGTGKKFRACGGGYDMFGTVFGDWLAETYQDELRAGLAGMDKEQVHRDYYGARVTDGGRVVLDGACGQMSMERIARCLLGLGVRNVNNRRGRTLALVVEPLPVAAAA